MAIQTKKRKRSPNFPCIGLGKAIARAGEVYKDDKTQYIPLRVLHSRWGYKEMSGMLLQTVAALLSYGLAEDKGSGKDREFRISDAARKILLGHPERTSIVQACALRPKVFGKLWEQYKDEGIPSDDVIKHYLIFQYEPNFNEDSVDSCIESFRQTFSFAGLGGSDTTDSAEVDEIEDEDTSWEGTGNSNAGAGEHKEDFTPTLEKPKGKLKNFTLPLTDGEVATLQVPHPMSEENYDILCGMLEVMKRALVSQAPIKPNNQRPANNDVDS